MVAVLDTGVRAQPWLDVAAEPGGGYDTDPGHDGDGFIEIDHDIQEAIRIEGEQAESSGDQPRQVIRHAWDTPVSTDPLIGELGPALGHGTFIAGIVRQVAPRRPGPGHPGHAQRRHRLRGRPPLRPHHAGQPDRARRGERLGQMVDVVSLSLGYFSESPADQALNSALWQAIKALLDLGVVVVAAAGNYSTSRMFYPAAFAQQPVPAGHVPLISVGALNPNGSKAVFSDGGHWVTAWASGGAVVSTLPTDVNGSRTPELRLPAHPANPMPPGVALPGHREALDPDDYSGGFGSLERHLVLGSAAGRARRPVAAGGTSRSRRPAWCSSRATQQATTEPRAGRPEEHGLAGLIDDGQPRKPSRSGQPRPRDRGARTWPSLMGAARQGSEDALGQIVTELSPLLWQVARAAGLSSGDAEDVLQTVWMRLVAHLDGIHDSRGPHRLAGHHDQAGSVAGARRGPQAGPRGPESLAELPDDGPGSEEQVIVDDAAARAVGGHRPALRALPGTAADHRLRAAP